MFGGIGGGKLKAIKAENYEKQRPADKNLYGRQPNVKWDGLLLFRKSGDITWSLDAENNTIRWMSR